VWLSDVVEEQICDEYLLISETDYPIFYFLGFNIDIPAFFWLFCFALFCFVVKTQT